MPPSAIAALAVNSTYYLRARVNAGSLQVYLQRGTDADAPPVSLVGIPDAAAGGGFDTTKLDILFARIVTGAAGSAPVVSTYANAAVLQIAATKQSGQLGQTGNVNSQTFTWAGSLAGEQVFIATQGEAQCDLAFPLGWARRPAAVAVGGSYYVGTALQTQRLSGGANMMSLISTTRDAILTRGQTDYDEAFVWSGGTLQWTAHWGMASITAQV